MYLKILLRLYLSDKLEIEDKPVFLMIFIAFYKAVDPIKWSFIQKAFDILIS